MTTTDYDKAVEILVQDLHFRKVRRENYFQVFLISWLLSEVGFDLFVFFFG